MRAKANLPVSLSVSDEKEVRKLFQQIDHDGSGTIEVDEYFLFALDIASAQGQGLESTFDKYDSSGNGTLDANECVVSIKPAMLPIC